VYDKTTYCTLTMVTGVTKTCWWKIRICNWTYL